MLMLTTILAVVVLPMTGVSALLFAVGRRERARDARMACQVAVTEAIHRDLGPVVAPVVKRRFGHGWRVEIAVPFEAAAIVGRIVAIAHATALGTMPRPSMIDVVLTAQEGEVRRPGIRRLAAGERKGVAWTGTTTSPAS